MLSNASVNVPGVNRVAELRVPRPLVLPLAGPFGALLLAAMLVLSLR